MSFTPERLFDLYFHNGQSRRSRRYRGRARLDGFDDRTLPSTLLRDIQRSFNEALALEKKNVLHADHGPLHFDYIDSDEPNALAFSYCGHSFIGVTVPLTTLLWNICNHLSAPSDLVTVLCLDVERYDRSMLHVTLFRLILTFVISHEWAHHVRGHVSRRSQPGIWIDEIDVAAAPGSMDIQSIEADADGYATYFDLAHLIDSVEGRQHVVGLLKLEKSPSELQEDRVLLSCFLAAFAGFVFVLPPPPLDSAKLANLTHPPQAARLYFLIEHAIGWCRQNRPSLVLWMNGDRFSRLTASVANRLWGDDRWNQWSEQVTFLKSSSGAAYIADLTARLDALKASGSR